MKLKDMRIVRFALIGAFNTLVDFSIYLSLSAITHSIIISNVAATSTALLLSYVLNAKFTFKVRSWSIKSAALFAVVTLFGLWALQTYLIFLFTNLLHALPYSAFSTLGRLKQPALIALPKLFATVFTLAWNFVWYNKVIFRKQPQQVALEELPLV